MSAELVHSSVPKGLDGDGGFTSVAITRGTPPTLKAVLVELSSYDFDPSRSVGADSVEWAHRIITVAGKTYTAVSRTAPCGVDWSGRPNRIAHHVVIDASERTEAGPAWLLSRLTALAESPPAVEERAAGPVLPKGTQGPRAAAAWTAAGFDAGWAGEVARTILDHPNAICYVVLPAPCNCLPLVADVFALLPAERRWFVTFSTRSQRSPSSVRCQLRFVRAGATGLQKLLNEPGVKRIVVTAGGSPEPSAAAEAARVGRRVEPSVHQPSARVDPVMRTPPAPIRARATIESSPAPAVTAPASPTVPVPATPALRSAGASRGSHPEKPAVIEPAPQPMDPTPEQGSIWVWVGFIYSAVAIALALVLLWAKKP